MVVCQSGQLTADFASWNRVMESMKMIALVTFVPFWCSEGGGGGGGGEAGQSSHCT